MWRAIIANCLVSNDDTSLANPQPSCSGILKSSTFLQRNIPRISVSICNCSDNFLRENICRNCFNNYSLHDIQLKKCLAYWSLLDELTPFRWKNTEQLTFVLCKTVVTDSRKPRNARPVAKRKAQNPIRPFAPSLPFCLVRLQQNKIRPSGTMVSGFYFLLNDLDKELF